MAKKEKKDGASVVRSMMVLGMTLVFIYAIFFGVHGDEIKDHTQALAAQVKTDTQEVVDTIEDIEPVDTAKELLDTGNDPAQIALEVQQEILAKQAATEQKDKESAVSARPQDLPGREFHSFKELFAQEAIDESELINLQGTWQWEGFMKSLEATQLDQYAQYILKDMDNTHYVFLGDYDASDLEELVSAKGGNIVAIEGKTTISQNQLRGDKIVFINLPDFKGIKVLLLVFFEEEQDVWFVLMDQEIYYAKKQKFGTLFDPWYNR